MSSSEIYLWKIYDVYWEYNLTVIFVTLMIVIILGATCIILMMRYNRKESKKYTIQKELLKNKVD